jgi:hypothetical protein
VWHWPAQSCQCALPVDVRLGHVRRENAWQTAALGGELPRLATLTLADFAGQWHPAQVGIRFKLAYGSSWSCVLELRQVDCLQLVSRGSTP